MADLWTVFRAKLDESLRPMPFALGGAAGLLLGYLGPFGSDTATLAQRYTYWPGVVIGGTLIGVICSALADALVDREGRRPIVGTLVGVVLMTPLATLFALIATRAMFGHDVMPGAYVGLLGPVFLLSLAMSGMNHLVMRRAAPPSVEAAAAPAPVTVRFLDRLPPRLRGAELHAVAAEDHYLRLYTARGTDLILMRLSDAIAELDGLEGAQTHRSWWVARAAVREVKRGDGRATLVLPEGVEAPVSRSFLPALRERGWL